MRASERTRAAELEERIRHAPDNADARRELAGLLFHAGEVDAATEQLSELVELYLRVGAGSDALRAARVALQLAPDSTPLRFLLARVHAAFPGIDAPRIAEPVETVIELGAADRVVEIGLADSLEMEPVDGDITRPPVPEEAKGETLEVSDEDVLSDEVALPDWPEEQELLGVFTAPLKGPLAAHIPASRNTPYGLGVDAFADDEETFTTANARATAEANARLAFERRRSAEERLRGEHGPDRVVIGDAPDSVGLHLVEGNDFLARLNADFRARVFARMEHVEYRSGATIFPAGTPPERLVIPLSGRVAVGESAMVVSPERLLCGLEFLSASDLQSEVTTLDPVQTIELSSAALAELRATGSAVNDGLSAMLRAHLIRALLAECPLFESLGDAQRADLAGRFFALSVASGETVIEAGDVGRRLMLVQTGALVVDGRRAGEMGRVQLQPGHFFGFVDTLLGRPAATKVVASAPSTLLVLSEPEVARLIAAHPAVVDRARAMRAERGAAPISVQMVGAERGVRAPRARA